MRNQELTKEDGSTTTTQQGKPESITLGWCIGSHQGCDCPDCYSAEQNGEL